MNTRTTAYDEEIVLSTSRFNVDSMMQSVRNFATLSEVLRILGAAVILASMSVFLLQGWNEGNDIRRYLLLLSQTGLLAAAGFAMSHVVRETKGARLFFGLALVSIPANFTILGALLYSVFQWDGGLTTYPGYADWRIEDVASIGITMAAAMVVIVPVTLFCFAIMARHSTRPLSLHFLVLNALLLLPIRSSAAAGSVALLGVVYALFVIGRATQQDRALKTGEGKFALATLFIPLGIILFRSMYFYHVDSLMVAMVGMVVFLAARQASLFPDRSARVALGLQLLSWPVAMVVALALTIAIEPTPSSGLAAPIFAMTYAVLAIDVIRRTDSRLLAKLIAASVSTAVALSFTLGVLLATNAATALLSVAAGLVLLLWGAAGRKLYTLLAGLITLAAGVLLGLDAIVNLVMSRSWIDLAIIGATAIALGSVVERHGLAIKLRIEKWYASSRVDEEAIALDN